MNEKKLNFKHRQEEGLDTAHQQRQESSALEFQTAAEMLQHDAANVEVPVGIAERLAESVRNEKGSGPWWKKMFK
jgi:hypothetical protein